MTGRAGDLGGVFLLDTGFGDFGAAGVGGTTGVYLLPLTGGRFALVESGPGSTVAQVRRGIEALGYRPEDLDTLLLTHIHLDHAGAAGALAAAGARVVVHQRGAPHLIAPQRLLASARRIYGDAMERIWGEMIPLAAEQIEAVSGGETLRLGDRHVDVVDSPGHATHHAAYLLDDGSLFCGDAAGIRLPGSRAIRPALPPPESDLEAYEHTVDRLRALAPSRLLLTHFGEVSDPEAHLVALPEINRRWAEEVLAGMNRGEDAAALARRIEALTTAELGEGAPPGVLARYRDTSSAEMTVMGLTRYWRKHHPERLTPPEAPR